MRISSVSRRWSVRLATIAGIVALGLAAVPASAQTFNPFPDFNLSGNPNGVWQYGRTPTLGGTFTLLGDTSTSGSIIGWQFNGGSLQLPGIFKNTSGSVVNAGTVTYPATNFLNLHPGSDGTLAVLRFVAPVAGTYNLTGRFQALDSTTTNVNILNNNLGIFSSTVTNGTVNPNPATAPGVNFNLNTTVAAGGFLDFAVGFGANNTFFNDSTGLSLTITPVSAVAPEPASLALLLGGMGTLCLRRRRR
jgi:hypothetical protein